MVDRAEAKWAVIKTHVAGIASGRQNRRPGNREPVIVLVLRYLIARHVEAAGIGQVVDVKGEISFLCEYGMNQSITEDVKIEKQIRCSHKPHGSIHLRRVDFRPPRSCG